MRSFDTAKMPEMLQSLEVTREKMKLELGNFWAGPDIKLEKEMVVEPGYHPFSANVVVNKENFPPLENLDSGVFKMLKQSMRSRYAQAGVEVFFSMFGLTDEEMEKINRGENVSVPVSISNKGSRPVRVSGDVLRFYWFDYDNRLSGKNLAKTVDENLKINGQYGKDWVYVDEKCHAIDNIESAENAVSIRLFLNAENKLYIPNAQEPLEINGRQDLENALKTIPRDLNPDFKIAETPKVSFSKNIVGEINTASHDNVSAYHASSPLIDPEFGRTEAKPIRAELVGKEHPDFIEMFIFNNNEKK